MKYGTSCNLFDMTTRRRECVFETLYPFHQQALLRMKTEKSLRRTDQLPFPLIHPKSSFKSFWQYVTFVCMAYTALILPYKLVFVSSEYP
jgi:hypothetical protein